MTAEFMDTLFLGLLTYLGHSTVFLAMGLLITGFAVLKNHALKEMILRFALFGALITTPLHMSGAFDPFFQPINIPEETIKSEPASFGLTKSLSSEVLPATPIVTTNPEALTPEEAGTLVRNETEVSTLTLANIVLMLWALFGAAFLFQLGYLMVDLKVQLSGRRALKKGRATKIASTLANLAEIPTPSLSTKENLAGPFCLGTGEIVLPLWAEDLPNHQLKAMLAHEIAHIKRADPSWILAAKIVQSIFFFQPLNIFAARRLSELSEFACDAWAGKVCGSGMPLAECLAECAKRHLGKAPSALGAAMATKRSPIVERTQLLLAGIRDYSKPASLLSKVVVLSAFLVGSAMIPVFAFDEPAELAQEEIKQTKEEKRQTNEEIKQAKEKIRQAKEEATFAEWAALTLMEQAVLAVEAESLTEEALEAEEARLEFEEQAMLAAEEALEAEEARLMFEEQAMLSAEEALEGKEARLMFEEQAMLAAEEALEAEEARAAEDKGGSFKEAMAAEVTPPQSVEPLPVGLLQSVEPLPVGLLQSVEPLSAELLQTVKPLPIVAVASSSDSSFSRSSHVWEDEDGNMYVKVTVTTGNSTLKIRAEGRFTGNADETGFSFIDDDCFVDISETKDGVTRRVRFEGNNGRIDETFWLNGQKVEKDRAMTKWVAEIIPEMYRQTGLDAKGRTKRIYKKGGTNAVLNEIDQIPGSYTLRKYSEILSKIGSFNDAQVIRLIESIKGRQGSYDLRETLGAIANNIDLSKNGWKAFAGAILEISSSYDRRSTLVEVAPEASKDAETRRLLLKAAHGVDGDYDKRETLVSLAANFPTDTDTMENMASVAKTISGDYDLRVTLSTIAKRGGYDEAGWLALMDAIYEISSDYDARETLIAFAEEMPRTPALLAKYRELLETIGGDYDRKQAEEAIL